MLMAVHIVASLLSLYYVVSWLDNAMHFLGGVVISMFFVWFFYFSGEIKVPAPRESKAFYFLLIAGVMALVGVGWELFEFLGDTYIAPGHMQGDLPDTMGDLLADILGGLVVALYFLPKINKQNGGAI